MVDDAQLLRCYAEEKSEAAFAELVERHLDLVYAAALRQVSGDVHSAKDIVQQVFTLLAQKAGSLAKHPVLPGWLYLTAHHCAARALRSEWRRRARERKAVAMTDPDTNSAPQWERARPVIDAAMRELGHTDREAVLLRYFALKPFAEIGNILHLSEDGARRRVERALEKLRHLLARRGVASTTAALSAALTAEAAVVAPLGFIGSVVGAALAGSVSSGVAGSLAFITMKKIQLCLAALIVTGMLGIVVQQQSRVKLRDELVDVRQQSQTVLRLQTENARLIQRAGSLDNVGRDELARLRSEASVLRKQISDAPTIPLGPGMTRTSAWRNVGRDTAVAALETLLWSAENASIQAVGRTVDFSPLARIEAEALFANLPNELREAGDVINPEEMVGLAWIFGSQLAGAQLVSVKLPLNDPDSAVLLVKMQKRDGQLKFRDIPFHRTPDGWRWVVSHQNLDFLGDRIGSYQNLLGSL